jgi:surface antigen
MRIRRRTSRRVSLTRLCAIALVAGVLATVAPALHPESVSAASGVDDYPANLRNAPQDSVVDPWQFYNRECTSFVAWRLNSENDVAFNDFFQGVHWGNASNWKQAATSLKIPVDDNAVRGAVAWWAAGSAGSSRGHVAWVETASDGAITIEEYNYLHEGHYDTRTISESSSLWPSGFIHIRDTVVRNTLSPKVSGTPQVGKRLKTSHGKWSQHHLSFHYQWLADGDPISGATRKTFKPTADQVGQRLRAKVTAVKSGAHTGTAQTPPTASVAHGVFANTTPPKVSGSPQVGIPLSATTGSWTPAPTFAYQWFAGDTAVSGATASTFTPTATQLGAPIKVRVTASAPGYRTMRVASGVTEAVAPGQFVAKTAPSVSGTAQVDQVLTAKPGTWTPAGKVHYQWLADGAPIDGATGTTYTPRAGDLRKQVAVQIRVTQAGYTDAVATSAASDAVAPGTFLNTREPAVVGTAQVGVELKADHGAWSPKATIAYQWMVDGVPIPGATDRTFTPRPMDVGQQVTVHVIASRPGYLTAVQSTAPIAAVLPGVIRSTEAPALTGHAVVGHRLHATSGSWSLTPDQVTYQWYAGRHAVKGATDATYQPTAADAGHRIHVVVTAHSLGYTPETASSNTSDRVVLGRATADKPTVTGHAVLGHTLTAHVASFAPSTATAHYRWYRGHQAVHGARAATYVVRARDVGHHVHVQVTYRATHWTPVTRRSLAVRGIRTVPALHVRTTIKDGRVYLRLLVHAPGVSSPRGTTRVFKGTHRVGRFDVVAGHGGRLLAHLSPGTHELTVVYHGDGRQTSVRTTVPVTVP